MICNSAAAPLASIRGTVASPRWRASTPKTTMIAIASPTSGHTNHIGYMISGPKTACLQDHDHRSLG